ncbi:hypothetical protein [uncultured Hymenobacter sp.]|uniref:hypothetical protein n=1 Tax=uncultured Hymenobacter sp. TaxID=170016 RepID=UPI0035C94B76
MKNLLFIFALVLSLGLIGYLYWRLNATEQALALSQKRFTDCEQVTFQLQMQVAQQIKSQPALPAAKAPRK